MNSSKRIRQIMILALFALMAASAAGAETAGERYIVILKSRSGPAPDVARLGGTITFRQQDQLNVTVPHEALPALRSDPLVRYVQSVAGPGDAPLIGEPEEPTPGTPRRLVPHATAGTLSRSRSYGYDEAGNITNIGDQQFVYDALGRLKDQTAFEQARQQDLGSRDQAVHNTAAAYGDPGVDNGVKVAFGNLGGDAGNGSCSARNPDGTMGMTATITFQTGTRETNLNGAVGHEGQHLLDAQGFIASFGTDASKQSGLTWDVSKNLTVLQTETNAYRITDSIYRSANQSFSMSCRGCTLGVGARIPADRDLAITRILANPTGPYRVTPQNQGNRQFPEWTTPPPQP